MFISSRCLGANGCTFVFFFVYFPIALQVEFLASGAVYPTCVGKVVKQHLMALLWG